MAYVEYEPDGKTIKARVQQKTDTLANWMANTMPLKDGEPAFVITGEGQPLQIRLGWGGKRFSELPNWIDFNNAQRVAAQEPGVLVDDPSEETKYMEVTAIGTYTYGGNTLDTITEDGYKATFWWTGSAWISNGVVKVKGDTPTGTDTLQSELIPKGKAVYDFIDPKFTESGNIDITPYTITGRGFDSNGGDNSASGQGILKNMPILESATTIYIRNSYYDSLTKYFFRDSQGEIVGSVRELSSGNMEIPVLEGGVMFNMSLYRNSAGIPNNLYIGYNEITQTLVYDILGVKIKAEEVSIDFLKTVSLTKESIEVNEFTTSNMLNVEDYVVTGKYIDGNGNVVSGGNNAIIQNHPADRLLNETCILSGIIPHSAKKLVFRDINGDIVGSVISLTEIPLIFTTPNNSHTFDLSLRRLSETDDDYKFAMINIGSEVLPYEPYFITLVSKIEGKEIYAKNSSPGGQSFDQDLNTTDDVKFNSINTGVLQMVSWSQNLPEWDGVPPVPGDIEIGDAYAHPDGYIKWRTGDEN